ncbi:hypothetical protein ROLI_024740 [Roseobacter fucihabitans]|uniref:Uncharacterized protein n=1 Tax=Roseobacter fucihabitans TaxID=1537242 RepID=A0ABZ2BV79_9RHOB|nr:hypothetical protein [Roseobacter litoralis]
MSGEMPLRILRFRWLITYFLRGSAQFCWVPSGLLALRCHLKVKGEQK